MGVATGKVRDQSGPNGIQMDVAEKLLEVNLFLTHDRFEAVLEKLASSGVPFIECDNVAGQQSTHEIGQRDIAGPEKKVGVIGSQHPAETGGSGFRKQFL
ncbi:hypothetical protein L9S41_00225 [Geoalkalibacter halelectricus]|uniref:Uncharacterized protein n=2 Tax=Geoalkalibacter halelectricus TaxID=2847045 RepID=A0ABY5ZPM9_9BACT|nr:hypothetical protein [Geoalkalibacter halelectricus]MDO3378857.1 hypothetical protein [Geoalkalibacter halelectricus]UWZ79840.1 hypothetical protein L9S41_00225 [Geoalkalibacter halelectricus]